MATIDTFLANFIVPILPYMIENRVGLDPSQTQTTSSWLLAESAAVSVIIRVPLAHFADKSASKRNWLLWALVIALASTASTALGSSCMSRARIPVLVLFPVADSVDQCLPSLLLDWCRPLPIALCGW